MSQKHTIVPSGFTAADVDARFDPQKFQRITARQARALAQAGQIRQFGGTGRLWQYVEKSLTHSSRETGDGRISLEIPFVYQSFITSEMRHRPSWDVMIEA